MSHRESVTDALPRLGKAGKSAKGPKGVHGTVPAGKHFMAVTLMAHIENNAVPFGGEHPVKRHRQLHGPKI
jgi:hypothetical protein